MTKTGFVRVVTASLAILVVVSGVAGKIGYGGICNLELPQILTAAAADFQGRYRTWYDVQPVIAVCPLGFLERTLAAREVVPLWWIAVGLVVLSLVVLGRVFCAWVCPAGLVQRIARAVGVSKPRRVATPTGGIWASYSSYAFLGGVLVASFVFRFPVFCFLCPVGLAFGSLFAVIRLFSRDPLSVELVLFPVLLGLELFVLKNWCRSICPLGALQSLVSSANRFFRPTIKPETCLASTRGINCQACQNVCSEGINLRDQKRGLANSCTKCLECYERCPVKAIKISLRA